MSDVKWTSEQLEAISKREGSILVSAAAGSGKTAVLVERVIRRICDEQDPSDISNLLIVTFTNAAASEMKARITAAVSKKVLEYPENRHLRRQLTKIDSAQITTVHAFCLSLVKEHFNILGLSTDFRLGDSGELEILAHDALEDMMESKYADKDRGEFYNLVEALSAYCDDQRLTKVVSEMFNSIQSHPYPIKWLWDSFYRLERGASSEPSETDYGKVIIEYTKNKLEYHKLMYMSLCKELQSADEEFNRIHELFKLEIGYMDSILCCAEDSWDEIREKISKISFTYFPVLRNCTDVDLRKKAKAVRDDFKDNVDKLTDSFFNASAKEAIEDMKAVLPVTKALFELVEEYDRRFTEEKRQRNLLDFNDLEHLTAALLIDEYKDGEVKFTSLAHELSERYDEIIVDEYQDTNLVQDLIFRSLSKNETNLYMVGDVKQSIYGFRLADPSIFVSKYELSHVTKLVLSKNFRSRPEVLDSINLVFEKIMTKALGGIDYTEREALYPGVNYPESDTPESELCMIEKRDGVSCQAEYAAKRIMEMLHDESFTVFDKKLGEKRRARPSDFAILLRSASNMALYKDALSRVGIRSYYETRERLLNTDEVSTVLALLEIIDNPHSDIQLASVMRSPIFGLTLTELTEISKNGDGDYYTRIKKTAEGEGKTAEKAKMFLNIIEDLRIISFDTTVDKLLRHIYYKLGVLRLYSSMGKDRKLNLIAFLDMARAFESKGYRGLYAFVNMAKRMLEVDSSPPTPVDPATDGVSIMTVHKSKGLEFPVVLYGELDHKFNLDDTSRDVLIHRDLGAGFKRRQNERRIEYPTLHRLAIKLTLEREMRSEEERIMYVAMTRAREKLIVICDYVESILEKAKSFAAFDEIPSAALLGAYRPLEWLAAATADKVKAKERGWKTIYVEEVTLEDDENIPESRPAADTDEEKIARIREQLGYQYEHLVATSVPSKLTATSLKGRYLDMEAVSGTPGKITYSKTPSFLSEEQQMSGSEKGIALHLAMQFIDFKKCLSLEGIASEINRLREKRILTEKQAESVEPEKIHRFFISPLGKQLMSSPEFYREFKFSILCDVSINEEGAEAVKNTPQGDSVLLQGVIDCYFVLPDDTLSLLDFKTDNVTGTFVEKRAKEYGEQIKSYAYALERITGKRVSEKYLYFFNADRAVKV